MTLPAHSPSHLPPFVSKLFLAIIWGLWSLASCSLRWKVLNFMHTQHWLVELLMVFTCWRYSSAIILQLSTFTFLLSRARTLYMHSPPILDYNPCS